jgi:hypothetical protein
MLIALPNKVIMHLASMCFPPDDTRFQDKTFTCTLFAPTVEFDRLITREDILSWFQSHFPDALSVLGEDKLLEDFEKNPRSPLITTKVPLFFVSHEHQLKS